VKLVRDNDRVFTACAADEKAAGIIVDALPTARSMLQPLDYAHHPQILSKLYKNEVENGYKNETYKAHKARVLRAYNFDEDEIYEVASCYRSASDSSCMLLREPPLVLLPPSVLRCVDVPSAACAFRRMGRCGSASPRSWRRRASTRSTT